MPGNYIPLMAVAMANSPKPGPHKPGPPVPPPPPPPPCSSFSSKQKCEAALGGRCTWVNGKCGNTPPPPPPPPPPCRNFTAGGFEIGLRCGSRSIVKFGCKDQPARARSPPPNPKNVCVVSLSLHAHTRPVHGPLDCLPQLELKTAALYAGSPSADTDDATHEPAYWGRNFSFTPPIENSVPKKSPRDMPGSHWVGDVTLRVQPFSCVDASK